MYPSAASSLLASQSRILALAAFALSASSTALHAQVVIAPTTPQVGSSNPATAAPLVPRPNTKPCVVSLFKNLEFANYTPKTFSYTPPASCPGPWAKVVFTADFTVTAGTQYDRSGAFYIGHANIFYGTTAEPGSSLSPSWHVERDLTDLSALLSTAQTGEANLGNYVGVYDGVNYNGIIYANAALEFYPATYLGSAPVTPDIVVPVEGPGGDAGTLNTTTDSITQVLTLPTNVERVYLDVIAQSQINDEFWYFCVPNDETSNLESCGNTAFRETEITIDGKPAGVAPVYPWIYTGGFDPYLWIPIPGLQTLSFQPYRVDLTPYAAVLGDGGSHTVGVSVFNADSYFLATANLLVYTDHGSNKVTGGLLSNTLSAAPQPVITENIKHNSSTGAYTGNVLVTSKRSFTLSGYVNTSHGRVETTVDQSVDFSSNQTFDVVGSTADIQNTNQLTTVSTQTTTTDDLSRRISEKHVAYPFTFDYSFVVNPDGSFYQATKSDQKDSAGETNKLNGFENYSSQLSDEVKSADTLKWDSSGNFLGPFNEDSSSTYMFKAAGGDCYGRSITASDQKLTSIKNGVGCE